MHKPIVVTFGRMNPPHLGHAKLVDAIYRLARKLRADAAVFPSWTQDSQKNPLPFKEKLAFLRRLFPHMNVAENPAIRSAYAVVQELSRMGYTEVYVCVGDDQVADFHKFDKYVVAPGAPKTKDSITLKHYEVVPVKRPASDWSATKMRALATAGDYATFRKGVPTTDDKLAREIYDSVRRHMGLNEEQFAVMTYGATPADAAVLREAFRNVRNVIDVSGKTATSVIREHARLEKAGRKVRVYVREALLRKMPLTESTRVQRTLTVTVIKEALARDIVIVSSDAMNISKDVREHIEQMFNVTLVAEAEAPKQPTEVDRLKNKQKQELLSVKQRQGSDMLQAQKRELDKSARENQEKIIAGTKARDIKR